MSFWLHLQRHLLLSSMLHVLPNPRLPMVNPAVHRIYNLRKPKTNIQILQQNVLLKHRHLMQFMRRHGRDVAAEVRAAYIETLSRVLSGHFKAYLTALDPLLVGWHSIPLCAPRNILIGHNVAAKVGNVIGSRGLYLEDYLWGRKHLR